MGPSEKTRYCKYWSPYIDETELIGIEPMVSF